MESQAFCPSPQPAQNWKNITNSSLHSKTALTHTAEQRQSARRRNSPPSNAIHMMPSKTQPPCTCIRHIYTPKRRRHNTRPHEGRFCGTRHHKHDINSGLTPNTSIPASPKKTPHPNTRHCSTRAFNTTTNSQRRYIQIFSLQCLTAPRGID